MHQHLRQNTIFIGFFGGDEALFAAPHRFSFNGQERDDEVSGEGNSLSFKYRVEDSRLGRFFSVDPLYRSYPWNSNYSFCENQVTNSIELEGLESWPLAGTVSTVNGPYKNQNEAEKAANINILEVQAFGSFGRVYLGGEEQDIMAGYGAALAAIEGVVGREVSSGRKE